MRISSVHLTLSDAADWQPSGKYFQVAITDSGDGFVVGKYFWSMQMELMVNVDANSLNENINISFLLC